MTRRMRLRNLKYKTRMPKTEQLNWKPDALGILRAKAEGCEFSIWGIAEEEDSIAPTALAVVRIHNGAEVRRSQHSSLTSAKHAASRLRVKLKREKVANEQEESAAQQQRQDL